jgi:hypothetical protein
MGSVANFVVLILAVLAADKASGLCAPGNAEDRRNAEEKCPETAD